MLCSLIPDLYCQPLGPTSPWRAGCPCPLDLSLMAQPPVDVNTPAHQGAGGQQLDLRRSQGTRSQHLEAAELVTRLTVLQGMFRSLVKRGVGTGSIESEAMSLIREKVAGPTGHYLLEKDPECDVNEPELDVLGRSSSLKCWRDVKLVRRLTSVRLRVVSQKLREARMILSEEMKVLTLCRTKDQVGQAWEEVRRLQRETWNVESPKHQRKVEHLTGKAENCGTHKVCRFVSGVVSERWKKLCEARGDDLVAGLGGPRVGERVGVDESGPCQPFAGQVVNPDSLLSAKYFSRPEDLVRLDNEEAQLKKMAQSFNRGWKPVEIVDCGSDAVSDDSEVLTFGCV